MSMPTENFASLSSREGLPRISVALGAYNGERFLDEQLGSLARQTVLPAELIASDDCSSDNTLSVLEKFARAAPFPVRILRNASNVGFTANMIRAAEQCEGPLIAFCDQDDVWSKDKVELCARFFADKPIRLLLHAAQPVDENLRPIGKRYPAVPRTFVAPPLGADPWLIAPGFALVMDKGLLGLADWRSRPLSRDLDGRQMDFDEWFYFLAWSTGEIGFLSRCLVLYRQHGQNVVGSPDVTWANRLRKLLWADFATHRDRVTVRAPTPSSWKGSAKHRPTPTPGFGNGCRREQGAGRRTRGVPAGDGTASTPPTPSASVCVGCGSWRSWRGGTGTANRGAWAGLRSYEISESSPSLPESRLLSRLPRRDLGDRSQPPKKDDRPTSSQNNPRCGRV